MSRWRFGVIFLLIFAPFLGFAGCGVWFLWHRGLGFWVAWPGLAAAIAGYWLAWRWQKQQKLLGAPPTETPLEWTTRDRQAWDLVLERCKKAKELPAAQLVDPKAYEATVRDLALELARFYHPKASDPFSGVTIPEILAVIEFAAHDLTDIVNRYLPAGNVVTVRQWQQAKQALDWYPTIYNAYWLASALFSPIDVASRYFATRVGMTTPFRAMQNNALLFFHVAFVQRLGAYLIEMNSGRLKVGAARYRELKARQQAAEASAPPAPEADQVTIALIGQTGVGKSSLINALLGENRAKTDVLPTAPDAKQYELKLPNIGTKLLIQDTAGYGVEEPSAERTQAVLKAVKDADLAIVVLHARNPARRSDVALLRKLHEEFAKNPGLKKPTFFGALTHIDLLSPSMEWQPPYDWRSPKRPKEQQIAGAVAAAMKQFEGLVEEVTPVCVAAGKEAGVREELLSTLVEALPEAKAVGLVRTTLAEADAGKARKIVNQMVALAGQAAKAILRPSP